MALGKYNIEFNWDLPEVAVAISNALLTARYRPMNKQKLPENVDEVKVTKENRNQYKSQIIVKRGDEKIEINLLAGKNDLITMKGTCGGKPSFFGIFPSSKLSDATQFFELLLRSDLTLAEIKI